MRDLGEAGEAAFSGFCAIAGITANKSFKDRHGWDLFIELEGDIDVNDVAKMHEPLIECKIQIKTTDARKRALPVTLSNLKAMATTPLPAFYVLLEFDGSDSPKKAFIRHVDKQLILEILTRIRAATANSKRPDLNKKTMLIKFGNETEIDPLTGDNIKKIIKTLVGPSPLNYVKSKQTHMEKVGFEKGAFAINFSINGEENLKDFINMHLGVEGSTEIQNISSFATRFGIRSEIQNLRSESAILKIAVVSDGKGYVQFRDRNNGSTIRYSVNIYRAGLAEWIPKKYQKVRLSTDQIDIQISLNNNNLLIKYNFKNDEPREISEHLKLLKLVGILSTPNNVDVTLTIDERQMSGQLHGNPAPTDFDHLKVIGVLENLKEIVKHFEYDDPLKLSLNYIYERRKTILHCIKIISPKNSNISFTFNLESSSYSENEATCLFVLVLSLGNISFINLIAIDGLISESETKTHILNVQSTNSVYKTNYPTSELDRIKLTEDIKNACENYISEHPVIDLTGDFLKSL